MTDNRDRMKEAALNEPVMDNLEESGTTTALAQGGKDATSQKTPALKSPEVDTPPKNLSKMALYRRRFMRNNTAVAGLIVFVILALFAIFGQYITPWDYQTPDFLAISQPPSAVHWFGTTGAGNDLFAQVSHGLGRSMIIAVVVSAATMLLSAFIGAGAAFFGGNVEKVILAVIHFMLLVPSFLLIALMVSGSGGNWIVLMVVLTLFGWMYPARVIWSLAISIREREYVSAARYMGVSSPRIIARHLVPNIGSLLIINFTLGIVSTVMSETSLSFLGLGVKLPDVSLGNLLTVGANSIRSATWTFWFPAGALMLLTISVALISDGLRDALDPNSSAGGRA
ncbi:ABC transporter permease [Changpingibacter yushuensis]|uniref:ABC transporter permease n=1 Tax=Changpingibacter yushuensis TaxID=2758440 RepID=UPI0015F35291|nr:ABC transporter permease [Changpingibacter yushuensis]